MQQTVYICISHLHYTYIYYVLCILSKQGNEYYNILQIFLTLKNEN